MRQRGSGLSAPDDHPKNNWKWSKSKVITFSVFGVFLLILLIIEVLQFQQYEENHSAYLQEQQEDGSLPPPIPSYVLDSLLSGNIGITETPAEPQENDEIPEAPPPAYVEVSAANNRRVDAETPVATVQESPSIPSSPRLRVSDEGEIVEVATEEQPEAGQTTEEEATPTSTAIEEQFYTPVTVTGLVTSGSDGTALSGVRISVKGTVISTVTDFGGKYAIAVPGNPQYRVLQFSYNGNISERTVQPDTKVIDLKF